MAGGGSEICSAGWQKNIATTTTKDVKKINGDGDRDRERLKAQKK